MKFKTYVLMVIYGIRHVLKDTARLYSGQSTNFAILQASHRLEKGLCIRNPRTGWGIDQAEKLVELIAMEKSKADPDVMAVEIGKAVLYEYIESKSTVPSENKKLYKLNSKIVSTGLELTEKTVHGGTLSLCKDDLIQDKSVEKLFLSRHSVRDFSDSPVDTVKLEKAISLALRAPSACNRQATQIYVISGEDRIQAGSSNDYHADMYLIITGNIKAYVMGELNDWIVSTSVFCGYLSLALHAEGIGSCIFRKDIIADSKYNKTIMKMCGIPDDEQIILEMAIGNYKDEFKVPVSQRRDAKDIIHYLK